MAGQVRKLHCEACEARSAPTSTEAPESQFRKELLDRAVRIGIELVRPLLDPFQRQRAMMFEHVREQRIFAVIVRVQRPLREPGARRDGVHTYAGKSLFVEEFVCPFDDLEACRQARAGHDDLPNVYSTVNLQGYALGVSKKAQIPWSSLWPSPISRSRTLGPAPWCRLSCDQFGQPSALSRRRRSY